MTCPSAFTVVDRPLTGGFAAKGQGLGAQHSPVDGVVAGRLADFIVARERTVPLPAVAAGTPANPTQPPVTVAPLRFHVSAAVRAAMDAALARVSRDIAHCKFRMLVFTGFGSRELRQFCA